MPPEAPSLDTIFCAAIEMASREDRAAYIAQACGPNQELRIQVEKLVVAHFQAGNFLESMPALADTTANPVSELPGTVIGPHKLLQEIGEGGMGTVFMAEQTEPVQRKVALKIIKPGMDSRQIIGRFEAERQALAMMDHPNIAKVLDAGTTDGERPYFVMELVKGVPITKYCDDNNLTPKERLELFIPVCHAVMHAHQKGIIHRDLKPSNVMVACYDDKPVPKVIDFGVAKATGQKLTERTLFTQFGQLVGTLEYMSPEQATLNALDIDTRSDIYSLGVLLYELLTGSTPFEKKRMKETAFDEILRIIREEEPPTPSTRLSESKETLATIAAHRKTEPAKLTRLVRGDLDWIIMKAIDKDRNRRYETANGFAEDVERYLSDEPVEACPPSAAYRLRKFARRHRTGILMAAVLTALLAALAGIGWMVLDRESRRTEITRQEQAREAEISSQVRYAMATASDLLEENQPALARQKLAEAKGMMGNERVALAGLAGEVDTLDVELERLRRFMDLIDKNHEAEDFPSKVSVLFRALACYHVLDREDWTKLLEQSVLGKNQAEQIRRTVYEELLWLAHDVAITHRLDPRSGKQFSPELAAQCALTYLRAAEKARPPTYAFYHLRADCQEALGQNEAARADQKRTLQTPPSMAIDHYLQGEAARNTGNKAEAIKAYEAALRLEPTHFWSMVHLGDCLLHHGRGPEDLSAVVWVYTGCIMKRPDSPYAYSQRAYASVLLGRLEEAMADWSKAIELNPKNPIAYNNRGFTQEKLGHWEKAITDYSKAIELDNTYAPAWNNRGHAYRALGQWAKTIADCSKAVDLLPSTFKHGTTWGSPTG